MASGGYEIQDEFIRKNVEKGIALGEAKGKAEGEAKGIARGVLTVLKARGLPISDEVRQRVVASKDLAELERWLSRAAVVGSAGEIFDTP